MSSELGGKLLGVLDQLSGGVHPGYRPVHARGVMFSGTFVPSPDAAELTRAPHASRPSTPVTVRFSALGRHATVADNASEWSSPQGMATPVPPGRPRPHRHRRPLAQRVPGADRRRIPGVPASRCRQRSRAAGPAADRGVPGLLTRRRRAFVEAPKPIPVELARQPYFAVTAFKFTNAAGPEPIRPVPPRPRSGDRVPDPRSGEQQRRPTSSPPRCLSVWPRGPVTFRVLVQMAEVGDNVTDATAVWPETRSRWSSAPLTISERVDELAPERRKIIFDPLPRVDGIDLGRSAHRRAGGCLPAERPRRRADAAK